MGWEFMQEGTPYTNQICELCGERVSTGRPFYIEDKVMRKVVHAACAWEREEIRQKKIRDLKDQIEGKINALKR